MEACLIATGVLMTAGLVVGLIFALRPARAPAEPPPRHRSRRRFDYCPACDVPLVAGDRDCPDCGLDLEGRTAEQLERIRLVRRDLRRLQADGLLDREAGDRVVEQLQHQVHRLRHRTEPQVPDRVERPVPADRAQSIEPEPVEAPRPAPPPLPRRELIREAFSSTPEPAAQPAPPPTPPRRSLTEHIGRYMHERNILWGELAGGLLIVGCSIALVLSLWRTLEALPYFTFLLSAGITGAVFGAGYYTFHHWRLAATSRGLLGIALLLTPLNLLLLADPGTRGAADALDLAVKVLSVIAFAGLVRTGGRDFAGTDELPGWVPRRWLLALAVVGAPAALMVPAVSGRFSEWLSLGCFLVATVPTVGRVYRDGRRADASPLTAGPATAVLLFVGLGLFTLFAAWGPALARADDLPAALRGLSLPVVLAGVPVLLAGLVVQKRVTDPAGLRAAGTAVALFGLVVLFASLVLAWPDPLALVLAAFLMAMILGGLAFIERLPWLYLGAIPCAALAGVVVFVGHAPAGVDAGKWLAEGITAAPSGLLLAGCAAVLLAVAEVFFRVGRPDDARAVANGAAGLGVVGLFIATVHGIEQPDFAAGTHLVCAAGFVAASFRWRYRVIAQAGVWLLLLGSLWALWAIVPRELGTWGLAVGLEALALAGIAALLGRRPVFARLTAACRDVATAAAVLAPVLAVVAAGFPTGAVHTGTLAVVAATALVLAGLYRQPAFTWIGSVGGLVALGHLMAYPLAVEPVRLAVLLALLVHATLATGAALLLGRAAPRQQPDVDVIGPLTRRRSPGIWAVPLRHSARLTSVLAVPLLFIPAAGLASVWSGLAAWLGILFLVAAIGWRERGAFALFQAALTWAAGLAGFAWVEQQEWFATSSAVDPRAIQAYVVAVGLLSIGWLVARHRLRHSARANFLWADVRPAVDRVVLAGLVIGHLVAAAIWVGPHALAEMTPASQPAFTTGPNAVHVGGPGAWLVVGVLAVALALSWRRPARRADFPVFRLTELGLTIPVLIAAQFIPDLAAASALRWGLATAFTFGSILLGFRETIGRVAFRLGFAPSVSATGFVGVRGMLLASGGVVLLLTLRLAAVAIAGQVPAGPLPGSGFREMGWTTSVVVPLAALVAGLAGTAVRDRSAAYASAGGWVWVLAAAGGYALGVVAGGGHLGPVEQMRAGLIAVGTTAAWALAWLAVEWRIPGRGLLTGHVVAPFVGLGALALVPLLVIVFGPTNGAAAGEFGPAGLAALLVVLAAGYWHARRQGPEARFHVIGYAALVSGIVAGAAQLGGPVTWWPYYTLALAWAASGGLVAVFLFWPPGPRAAPSLARRLWPELLAGGLALLGVMGSWWSDTKPPVPAGMFLVAALLIGAVGFAAGSRVREHLSGALVAVAAVALLVRTGPHTGSTLALAVAAALAAAAWVWSELTGHGIVTAFGRISPDLAADFDDLGRAEPRERPDNDRIGSLTRRRSPETLPPFPHVAVPLALVLLLFGLLPTWAGSRVDSPWLVWGAVGAVGLALAVLFRWDRRQRFAAPALFALGAAAVGLVVAELRPGAVWLDRVTPLALAGYTVAVSALAWRLSERRAAGEWLVVGQSLLAMIVIGMGVRTAVEEPELMGRLAGAVAAFLLVPAAWMLTRAAPDRAAIFRPATLILGAVALGVLAWAVPDPAGPVPWLSRHAGLFAALTAVAAGYLGGRRAGPWAGDLGRVGFVVGGLALVALGVELVQQIPQFDPAPTVRKTPLDPVAVGAVVVGILGLIGLALRLALRPDRDPLGPTTHGRTGYVYLAEILLVLLFAHVRLNVPQVFTGQAVRYWTFIVMLLAFVGVGLAEAFARRGLHVLSRPLLRTGVLLPLIPLVAFWAKPPGFVFEFADARAPGLRPMLGYLEKLPQHFDAYALLWFLAGLLYGLIALSRRSFGWALLGALATNAGLWSLLAHHEVPAAVHPQAWAIPLALIVLVSEHVNRGRLRADVASGLRYLGIAMIYVSSAADLFIVGVGQAWWLPIVLAALCLAGVVAGVLLRVRAFLYLGIGFLMLDVFAMIWHAAVDRQQTWVWYASGIVLGALIIALFAVLEKRRNDVRDLVGRLREWD